MSDSQTTQKIAAAMIRFGGSFASNLGRALQCADEQNEEKIRATWPDLMARYSDMAANHPKAIELVE